MENKCNWKPPEGPRRRKEYQCPHPVYPGDKRCIFHIPLKTKKEKDIKTSKVREAFDAFFEDKVLKDQDGKFVGFEFPDGMNLDGRDFRRSCERAHQPIEIPGNYVPVDFTWAVFGVGIKLRETHFGHNTSFNKTIFKDKINFKGATFGGSTQFRNTTFGDYIIFNEAGFGDKVNFKESYFGEQTRFIDAIFCNNVSFSECRFGDWAYFDDATFGKGANFTRAEFGNEVTFIDTYFGDQANFNGADFGDDIDFTKAVFRGTSDFSAITGQEKALYHRALNKNREENQSSDLFRGGLYRRVPPKLVFRSTRFKGFANFQENDLSRVRFQQVSLRNLTFFNSQISQTKFVSCLWGTGPENCRYARWELPKRRWSFKRPRILLDELICRDKQIEERKKWIEGIKADTRTPRTWLPVLNLRSRWSDIYDSKIRDFRKNNSMDIQPSDIEVLGLQLKQSLEATRDPITAGDFHFAVMEMKREQAIASNRRWRARMLRAYKFISGYGERYGRTALWLAMLIGIFSFIYFQMNGLDATATLTLPEGIKIIDHVPALGFWKQVWFSIAFAFQNVLPFKLYSNYLCAVGPNLHWVRGLAMGETLVGTTLFTFFALALRRRFKR